MYLFAFLWKWHWCPWHFSPAGVSHSAAAASCTKAQIKTLKTISSISFSDFSWVMNITEKRNWHQHFFWILSFYSEGFWSANSSRDCIFVCFWLLSVSSLQNTTNTCTVLYLCDFCVTLHWSVVPRETPYRRSAAAPFCTCSAGPSSAFWKKRNKQSRHTNKICQFSITCTDVQSGSLGFKPVSSPGCDLVSFSNS